MPNKTVEDIIADVSSRSGQRLSLSGRGLVKLPERIWEMGQLLRLEVDGNELTSLPADIAFLPNLIVLNLDSNQLTTLPSEIGSLAKFARLHLDKSITCVPIGNLSTFETTSPRVRTQSNRLVACVS